MQRLRLSPEKADCRTACCPIQATLFPPYHTPGREYSSIKQQTVSAPLPDGSGRHGLFLYPVGFPVGLLGADPLYALRSILQLDAPVLQLVPDAVCLGKVLCRTGSLTLSDQILDLCVQILGLAVVE